jgi:murein DD-endopeptidase MepM/ murein hydrolase activator NlpD
LTTEVPAPVPAPRVTVEVQVATPTGRRARAILLADDLPDEAAAPATGGPGPVEPQWATPEASEVSAQVAATGAPGSGRRRRPAADLATPIVATPTPVAAQTAPGFAATASTGRRRKATTVEALPEAPAAGNGRRRRAVGEPQVAAEPAAVFAKYAAAAKRGPAAKHAVAPKPAEIEPAGVEATVEPKVARPTAEPKLARPTAEPKVARPTLEPKVAEPTVGPKVVAAPGVRQVSEVVDATGLADVVPIEIGRSHRHRAKSGFPIPGNPALVAGAAAVAIATVGVVASTAGGSDYSAAGTDLARASVLGLDRPVAQAPAAPDPTAAARASRDHARQLLALRLKNEAKQNALEKALKLAAQRATRLAALAKEFFLPVKGYHLTAGFGEGGGLWAHGHTGQDFACPTGTPIHALASGTIVFTGWYGAYGWLTVERLADTTEIWYAHQSKILVHSGAVVAGQVIGHVGSTGNTTGPHLHLEVHPNGGPPVDPMPWLRAHGMHP